MTVPVDAVLAAPLPEPAWGWPVALYLIVIGVPSGLGLLTWWLATQGGAQAWFERRAHLVSLVSLAVVGVLLVADLGRPGGLYLMVTRFDNLGSPIAVGAKLIAVKAALLGLAWYAGRRAARGPETAPTRVPALRTVTRILLAMASFALAIYPAALLARAWSSPLGGTSGAALLFLTSSLLLGAAAAVALHPALAVARRLLLVLVAGHAITLAFEALAVTGDPRLSEVVSALASGRYAAAWWLGAVAAGVAVPVAALSLFPRHRGALMLAALGAAAGAVTTRYLLFAVGG